MGKIPKIVTQLSPLSALVAASAAYFKGKWKVPFRSELTRGSLFHTVSGQTKTLPMMTQSGFYPYYENRNVQAVTLPYSGGVSIEIVLPRSETDLPQFRQTLNSGLFESWIDHSKSSEGVIELPRFKADFEAQLSTCLAALGMERAFDPQRAEFNHVQTDQPPVWIDQVNHRAVVEVNEAGTEAAAVTVSVVVMASASYHRPRHRFHVTVDRPFFLVLRDDATKVILFMGWIGDPD